MDGLVQFVTLNVPWVVALGVAAVLGMQGERWLAGQRRAEWRAKRGWKYRGWKYRRAASASRPAERADPPRKAGVDFAADQLKTVSRATFTARALLNRSEAKVFAALDNAVIARNPGWQVMAQVSLGEFLASPTSRPSSRSTPSASTSR